MGRLAEEREKMDQALPDAFLSRVIRFTEERGSSSRGSASPQRWDTLDEHVKIMKATLAERRVPEADCGTEGPFDRVAQEVEVVSPQKHQYFKIREIEKLLSEEIEKLRDAADRDRLQYERQLSELKRSNHDLQRQLGDQATEIARQAVLGRAQP
jgi:hypothetical protein